MPFWSNAELLPSSVREKVRKGPKRSKEQYAKSREKVKDNVQEAKEHGEQNKNTAEVMLYIEINEEELKEKMKDENLADVVADFSSYDKRQWGQMQQTFAEANFDLSVDKSEDGTPRISMTIDLPEGNVAETMSLSQDLQEAFISRALRKKQ